VRRKGIPGIPRNFSCFQTCRRCRVRMARYFEFIRRFSCVDLPFSGFSLLYRATRALHQPSWTLSVRRSGVFGFCFVVPSGRSVAPTLLDVIRPSFRRFWIFSCCTERLAPYSRFFCALRCFWRLFGVLGPSSRPDASCSTRAAVVSVSCLFLGEPEQRRRGHAVQHAASPVGSPSHAHTPAVWRPNRRYNVGTTIMFSSVDVVSPHRMTMAIGV
jgi:hypothetical protein